MNNIGIIDTTLLISCSGLIFCHIWCYYFTGFCVYRLHLIWQKDPKT